MYEIDEIIRQVLMDAAHYPILLYAGIILILFASSFGLPLPEEVVLLTSGTIAYFAMSGASLSGTTSTINPYTLAFVCFLAVLLSDVLVFWLGKKYGLNLLKRPPLNRYLTPKILNKVEAWTEKYGAWACALFRFTPGIRFPGHFMCGAMKISYLKFLLTDGIAALITVPSQVLLIAFYGDEILGYVKQFKVLLITVGAIAFVVWFIKNKKENKVRA